MGLLMNIDISRAVTTIQGMVNGLVALLPNLAVALIVFALTVMAGRGVRTLVRRLTLRYRPKTPTSDC